MPSSECEHITFIWVTPGDLRKWLAEAERLIRDATIGDNLGLASFQIGRDSKHMVNIVLDQDALHAARQARSVEMFTD